jgi:hypothetical protein
MTNDEPHSEREDVASPPHASRRRMGWKSRVTVVIAAMALGNCALAPWPRCFHCRGWQSEARGNLKALLVAEESFRADHDRYGSIDEIGFSPRGKVIRYQYEVRPGGPDGRQDEFIATATAISNEPEPLSVRYMVQLSLAVLGWACAPARPDIIGDAWSIDQNNELKNEVNACR